MMLRLDLTWLRLCVAIRFARAAARDTCPGIEGHRFGAQGGGQLD